MRRTDGELSTNEQFYRDFVSPIPPHLTPEERKRWEEELEWERQEYERRKKAGYYPHQD